MSFNGQQPFSQEVQDSKLTDGLCGYIKTWIIKSQAPKKTDVTNKIQLDKHTYSLT